MSRIQTVISATIKGKHFMQSALEYIVTSAAIGWGCGVMCAVCSGLSAAASIVFCSVHFSANGNLNGGRGFALPKTKRPSDTAEVPMAAILVPEDTPLSV